MGRAAAVSWIAEAPVEVGGHGDHAFSSQAHGSPHKGLIETPHKGLGLEQAQSTQESSQHVYRNMKTSLCTQPSAGLLQARWIAGSPLQALWSGEPAGRHGVYGDEAPSPGSP